MTHNDTFAIRDRRAGFLWMDHALIDARGAEMGTYGIAVYVALCRYANGDGEAWPSYNTIAKLIGGSRRQVIREIGKLEAMGIVAVERERDGTNVYILLDTGDTQSPPGVRESPPSVTQSPKVVTGRHPPVTHSHVGGVTQSPKQDPMNNRRGSNRSDRWGEPETAEERRQRYIPDEYSDLILG